MTDLNYSAVGEAYFLSQVKRLGVDEAVMRYEVLNKKTARYFSYSEKLELAKALS